MSSKSNPRNVNALHKQIAHEAKERTRKYDDKGKRKKGTKRG
jgi:hypothetical protein